MTDLFNIDLPETESFRIRNNLDWRKFRDNYNKLSASKLERGIKPLPISLLLKLFGPQKVLNTFVVTRRNTAELDYLPELASGEHDIVAGMKGGGEKDKPVAKTTLNFPGEAVFINPEEIKELVRRSSSVKSSKYEGLPSRPVFQRGLHVPGRYFPKPSHGMGLEDGSNLAVPYVETTTSTRERPWTYTPRTLNTASSSNHQRPGRGSNGFKGKSAVLSKNAKVIRGSVCKSTDGLSASLTSRAVSGKSFTTVKSSSTLGYNNEQNHTDSRRFDGYPNSVHNDIVSDHASSSSRCESNVNVNGDVPLTSDVFNVKRLRLSARQVSFPRSSQDFSTVLHGRPKTLHRRESSESAEPPPREQRARTHVGFAVSEMT